MSATITVSVRIPLAQAKVIKRAAKDAGRKLASYVREATYHYAIHQLALAPTDREITALANMDGHFTDRPT